MVSPKFEDLVRRPAGDSYIYRGESKANKYVCSSLFREYSYPWDVETYQRFELEDAKRWFKGDERTLLADIQHYGGKTNLIDFTTCYYIALFFACESRHDKDGRIILLDRSRETSECICEPSEKNSRAKAQRSIFVRPPKGYIEDGQYEVLTIPKQLKRQLLNYLDWKHNISRRSVYNDIHGFIKYREVRREAWFILQEGCRHHQKGEVCDAIKHYSKAISLNSDLSDAYNNRGLAYKSLGEYARAIEDYNVAERLHPDAKLYHNRGCAYSAMGEYKQAIKDFDKSLALNIDRKDKPATYGNRGLAWLHLFEWEKAKADLACARQLGWDIKPLFHDYYESVADFERKHSVEIPKDIAAMLSE